MATTLSVEEILLDVMDSFKVSVPGLSAMGTDFRASSLKLNKTYDAHIAGIPEVTDYDANSGGYQANATDARTLLTDVPVTVSAHKKVSLYASHLDAIKDDKREYAKVIAGAGYSLAKGFTTAVANAFNSRNVSQSSTYSTANSDYDAIENIRSDMNLVGASALGRVGIVNTNVASSLHLDDRIINKDYMGDMDGDNAFRVFRKVCGFQEVREWPDLPTNNGTAVGVASIATATELVTTDTAHGLVVGDRCVFAGLDAGVGLTEGTLYYVIETASTTTLKVSATSGGSAVNITTAYADGTIAKVENLTGMFFEPRAISVLAGIPDDFDGAAQLFGAPATYKVTTVTDPDSGLTFAALAEVTQGTLRSYLHITHVYGVSVGKQAFSASAGALTDYAGHRLISA